MTCASEEELIQYLDGELSVNRCRELDLHLAQCSLCATQRTELQQLTSSLAGAQGEFSEPDLAPEILARVRTASQPASDKVISLDVHRRRKRLAVVSAIGISLAAAAVLLLVVAPWSGDHSAPHPRGGFSSRGADGGADAWRALWIYRRVAGTRRYEEVKQTVSPDDALVFGYLEATGRYPYLMVFGVSSDGNVYWYYPAYERKGDNPESLMIKRGRHELKAEIEHDLSPGTLRMIALFSTAPLRVSDVERAVKKTRRKPSRPHWQLPLANTEQLFRELKVGRRR